MNTVCSSLQTWAEIERKNHIKMWTYSFHFITLIHVCIDGKKLCTSQWKFNGFIQLSEVIWVAIGYYILFFNKWLLNNMNLWANVWVWLLFKNTDLLLLFSYDNEMWNSSEWLFWDVIKHFLELLHVGDW